ncbi:TIGR03086 family protein [Modestobacter sp. I12A-02628]|uniref:TIGR03086 family protein n=1 Tax=Goekera deserti TaxID=2497753 RepID=A0A7K3WIM2_9ACTN|nr:TIGR03086 family protein [Goekera deserti]NDI47246.1 TIGR03086 family protein [Goekera deserti]NEL55353.1 TIGR03086 family protein [Goekera deserti]
MPDLTGPAAELVRLVDGVRDEQLGAPTPCAATSVAGLLDHLLGLTHAFRLAAAGQPMPGPAHGSAAALPAIWRALLPHQLDVLAQAWAAPEAWLDSGHPGHAPLPAGVLGLIALDELVVHGWDLAVATGQEHRPDPVATQLCLAFLVDYESAAPDAFAAMFGPRVPVPGDAPGFRRLLGQTGRDPDWSPPG